MKQNTRRTEPPESVSKERDVVRAPTATDNVVRLDKRRTTVDFSLQSKGELNWLMNVTGCESRGDIIGTSLTLFSALVEMEHRDVQLFIQDSDGSNALLIPSFRAVNGLLRSSCKTDRTRFTLELPAMAVRNLEKLKASSGERKTADVIRQAVHLHWVLLNEVEKGRKVVVNERTSGNTYELFDIGVEIQHDKTETAITQASEEKVSRHA